MKFKKYYQKKRSDSRIDRNEIWKVYNSDAFVDEVVLNFVQLGGRTSLDIKYDGETFDVYINDSFEESFDLINGTINRIEDVVVMIRCISDKLIEDNIIRGRLGGGIFENGSWRSNSDAYYFCKECFEKFR